MRDPDCEVHEHLMPDGRCTCHSEEKAPPPDMVADVRGFHLVSQQRIGSCPDFPSVEERQTRVALLVEEINEYMEAENEDDLAGVGHELIDIIFVALGTGISYGLPMQEIWDAVSAANMAKSENGRCEYVGHKIRKPEGWVKPDVAAIVERHRGE